MPSARQHVANRLTTSLSTLPPTRDLAGLAASTPASSRCTATSPHLCSLPNLTRVKLALHTLTYWRPSGTPFTGHSHSRHGPGFSGRSLVLSGTLHLLSRVAY